MAERLKKFGNDFDHIRSAVVNEPRGSDVIVGGMLCPPNDPSCTTGILYFNNGGVLGMCGHGTIGVVTTLRFMDRIDVGVHRIETPVGVVTTELHENGEVSVQNVRSFRSQKDVSIEIDGYGIVTGDIAWGGNWFFLVKETDEDIVATNVAHLTSVTWKIRKTLEKNGILGDDGAIIDHIELFADSANADSKNFVLCPGGAYDRSPCGTRTSAKLACLAADGELNPKESWRQESIIGSIFECSYQPSPEGGVIPTIRGSAHVCSQATLLLDPNDPFCMGIPQ